MAAATDLGGRAQLRRLPVESHPSPASLFTHKQQLAIVAGLCGVALAAAGIISVWTIGRPKPAAAAATETGVFRPSREQWQALSTAPVQVRAFNALAIAEGHIEADAEKTTPVISPFTGRVLEVFASAGQKVDRKTRLFSVAAAEVVQGRSDLATALAGLDTAQAQLKLARETETRQGELYRNAGGALKDWRQAQSDAIAAEGQARSAEAAVNAARNRLAILGQGDQTASARAAAIVFAPAAGTLIQRALAPGQNITAGGDTLFSISDLSTVWLTAQVRESDAAKVRLGANVSVTTPAYPGRLFTAKVVYIAPTLDADTHRLPVRAAIANRDGALKPQMFARFRIDSGVAARSPAAPEAAVIRDGDTARVWVAGDDGVLRLRPVETGAEQDGLVQITAGLKPGDKVVTRGALFVDQAGQPE